MKELLVITVIHDFYLIFTFKWLIVKQILIGGHGGGGGHGSGGEIIKIIKLIESGHGGDAGGHGGKIHLNLKTGLLVFIYNLAQVFILAILNFFTSFPPSYLIRENL
jgi:hypothetical protein